MPPLAPKFRAGLAVIASTSSYHLALERYQLCSQAKGSGRGNAIVTGTKLVPVKKYSRRETKR